MHTILSKRLGVKVRWGLFAALFYASPVAAQLARGVVRDATGRLPVSGAVVVVLDSSGAALGRNITNERGEYAVAVRGAAARLRVQRIGFRMREVELPQITNGVAQLDILLAPIATFLSTVRVTAQAQCSKRADRASAFELLEQARAGLLTTIVARESNAASLVRFTYDRTMRDLGREIERQVVNMTSEERTTTSFVAAHAATDFVKRGFVDNVPSGPVYYAPDAEVLLDSAFSNGYCFHIMETQRNRPNQIGLGFKPADKKQGRVDIDGALWIDTVARALSDIEFAYVGTPGDMQSAKPGGRIEFHDMGNGVVMVTRWNLRIAGMRMTQRSGRGGPIVLTVASVHETGGEVAHARWPDGHRWDSRLGTLRLYVTMEDGSSPLGREFWLTNSPYISAVDSLGVAEFNDLLPGPYTMEAIEPKFSAINVNLPVSLPIFAVRDAVLQHKLRAETAESFVRNRCISDGHMRPGYDFMLFGRVMSARDSSVADARIQVDDTSNPYGFAWRANPTQPWKPKGYPYKSADDGLFQICASPFDSTVTLMTIIKHKDYAPLTIVEQASGRLLVLQALLQPLR